MVFKKLRKHPERENRFIVDIAEAPNREFSVVEIDQEISDLEAGVVALKKLKKDALALVVSE